MEYVVTLRDGEQIECDEFEHSGIDGLVELQIRKPWREHKFQFGSLKFGSIVKVEMRPLKIIPLADIKHIMPIGD